METFGIRGDRMTASAAAARLSPADVRYRRVLPVRVRAGGSRLAGLLDQMRSTLDQDWPVNRMAVEAAVSPRALHRRFHDATGLSPGAWLLAERIARARELLEGTALSIDDIAATSGFKTAATLRHHFRASLGTSPAAYRARFSRRGSS